MTSKGSDHVRSGHTLLELLVVVAIMTILAGVVLPSASPSAERQLDTVQRAIQDALDLARSHATSTGFPHGVRFSTEGKGWFAVLEQGGFPTEDPLTHGEYVVRFWEPGFPRGVVLKEVIFGSRSIAVFDEKGILNTSGLIRLRAGTTERVLSLNTTNTQLETVIPGSSSGTAGGG
ncbi:MAG: prepilin-type N-terminal cleavage/methylation domain-containing protein [Planctomycetota bacterium]|nr:prepilin-type N-terminal cleavage/methylation domain-containing protein [Planctomycetota bacterium]